mmetsp:Transcript_14638/g.29519  ORF Transcript_14638/g.29519 Transcript_14638/m.29519 type:complete len:133 (+) Transcript_14638:884-1282(+)
MQGAASASSSIYPWLLFHPPVKQKDPPSKREEKRRDRRDRRHEREKRGRKEQRREDKDASRQATVNPAETAVPRERKGRRKSRKGKRENVNQSMMHAFLFRSFHAKEKKRRKRPIQFEGKKTHSMHAEKLPV